MFIELGEFENLKKVAEHAAHEIAEMYDEWADDTIQNVSDEEIEEEGFDGFDDMAQQAMDEVFDYAVEVFSENLRQHLLGIKEEEEEEFKGEISEEEEQHEEDVHTEDESNEGSEEEEEEEEK